MPVANDLYLPDKDSQDTVVLDTSDVTYDYIMRIPRGEVTKAGSLAAAQALPVAYIKRTTKATPYVTEAASSTYSQIWNDRATITSWA